MTLLRVAYKPQRHAHTCLLPPCPGTGFGRIGKCLFGETLVLLPAADKDTKLWGSELKRMVFLSPTILSVSGRVLVHVTVLVVA